MRKISSKLQKATAWLLAMGMTLSAIQPTMANADTEMSDPAVEVTSGSDTGSGGYTSIDIQASKDDSSILDVKTSNTKDSDQEIRLHLWEFDEGFFEDYDFTKTSEKNVKVKDMNENNEVTVDTKEAGKLTLTYVKAEDDTDCYVEFTAVAGSDQSFSIAFQGPENGLEDIQMVVEPELVDSNTESDQAGSPVQLTVKALQNPEPVQENDNTDASVTLEGDTDSQMETVTGDEAMKNETPSENSSSDTTSSESQGNADSEARIPQNQSLALSGDPVRVEYDGLTVIAETATSPNRVPAIDEDGTLRFYTGETAMTTISVSNPSGSEVANGLIHIYMRSDDPDYRINIPLGPSNVTVGNNVYQVNVTEGYCIEIPVPKAGDTISINVGSSFASALTGGGLAVINAEMVKADGSVVAGDCENHIIWDTNPNPYPVKKDLRDTWKITGSGTGDGMAYLNGLSYSIEAARSGDTLEGIGEDPLTKISLSDTMTLPEGWSFTDEVQDSFASGTVTYSGNTISYGEKTLFTITTDNNISITSAVLSDDGRKMTVTWDCQSANAYQYVTTFGDYTINADHRVNAGDTYELTNDVTATESYTYSEDQIQNDSVTSTITAAESSIDLTKTLNVETYDRYGMAPVMGSYAPFTITMSNPGVTSMPLGDLTDNVPTTFYIAPEDIEAMFNSEKGGALTLTITNATIAAENTKLTVTGIYGDTHETTIDDTWTGTTYDGLSQPNPDSYIKDYASSNGATITFQKGNDCIVMNYDSNRYTIGENGYYKSIEEAFDSINFKNTYYTQYNLLWDFDNTGDVIYGGQTLTIDVPTTAKSSFMLLTKDAIGIYDGSGKLNGMYNGTRLRSSNTVQLKRANDSTIYKTASVNNIYFFSDLCVDIDSSDDTMQAGQMQRYTNTVYINNEQNYEQLPLISQIVGSQVLAVPQNENQGADWIDKATVNTQYNVYLLTQEGTYDNVYVESDLRGNTLCADRVVVEDSEDGLKTTIYWYLDEIEQQEDSNWSHDGSPTYKAFTIYFNVYGTSEYSDGYSNYYSATTYLGDYQGHRLIDSFDGTTFDIDKDIVTEIGDTQTDCENSAVGSGDKVIYRLTMLSTDDHSSTVIGSEMSDELPLSIDGYRWSKDNITISYSGFNSISDESGAAWEITQPEASSNTQYIKWSSDFTVTFNKPAYIWVTLKYPETGSIEWDKYVDAYSSTNLINSFKVDGPTNMEESVTHNLKLDTEVILQKGVYATGTIDTSYKEEYEYSFPLRDDSKIQPKAARSVLNTNVDSRLMYSNSTSSEAFVAYYVLLYNDGNSNLYLSDMTDVLPEGYTFYSLANSREINARMTINDVLSSSKSSNAVAIQYADALKDTKTPIASNLLFANVVDEKQGKSVSKAVNVSSSYNARTGKVTFSFKKSTTPPNTDISYDEKTGDCYLKPGESIQFAYICLTNGYEDTADECVNSIAMPVINRAEGKIKVGDSDVVAYDTGANANDGSCSIIDNSEAMAKGFTNRADDVQWVESEVTVYRGGIKPGISKVLKSAESLNGVVTANPVTVAPNDTLTWETTINNDGTNAMVDYSVTDELPYPYTFTGPVTYDIYDSAGKLIAFPANDSQEGYNKGLFTITNVTKDEDGRAENITLKYYDTKGLSVSEKEVTMPVGTEISFTSVWEYNYSDSFATTTTKLKFVYNDDEKLCMRLEFTDSNMAIPVGCEAVMGYQTVNLPNEMTNRTYVNNVYVTPMVQTWSGNVNVGNYVDGIPVEGLEEMPSVRNSAPFTVANGYATTSDKAITELDNEENTASSTSSKNYIVLEDASKLFTYTLTVDNVSDRGMDKLILIDNLPQVGDHDPFNSNGDRDSEFAVSLADNPSFMVTVAPDSSNATWTEHTLTSDQYLIQYSTKTEFDTNDWSGSDAGWTTYHDGADLSSARSIRLVILDDEGTLIPANANIKLTFAAKADENAKAGEYAWNSFGYHYSMVNSETELEAAPLEVGVAITGKPVISKSTVDKDGNPSALEEDATYRYILYKGHYMTGINGTSNVDDVVAALKDEGTEFSYIELNVPAGETVSDQLSLADIYTYDYSDADGFTTTDTPWTWENDASYTLWEIPSENYTFENVNGGETINNAFTFTYTNTRNQTLECVNELIPTTFDIRVNKYYSEEVGGTTYTGAVEGAVLQVWNADKSEMIDEQTVDETGYVTFTELEVGDYVLVEAKASDHFITASDIAFTVNKDGTITTENSDNIGTDDNGMYLKMKDEMEDGTITILKYADDEKSPLAGVTYTLYDSADQVVDTKVTGEDGKVTFTDIPFGDYTIVETQTADGYSLLAEPISVTIPLVMTAEEAHANDADTTQAFYDKDTDSYIFFDLTYNVTDDATFVLPTTGSNNLAAMAMGGIGFMIILAGWLAYKRKKGYKGIINS